MTGSALYVGTIRHRRAAGPRHAFRYPIRQVLIDLDEIDEVAERIRLFSHNRFNLLGLDDRDFFGPEPAPIRGKLEAWLAGRDVALGDGPVRVLTGLRVLGHSFDPVRFYFCHEPGTGAMRFVVAEVRSTFGEAYAYLLPATGGTVVRAEADKRFHVSPFLEDRGTYRFRITPPGKRLSIHIDLLQDGIRVFDATLSGVRRPLSSGPLAAAVLGWAGAGVRTLARIHWQALRLWVRGAKVVPKPAPPDSSWSVRHG